MDWYYADNGKQVGPVNEADWAQLVGTGKITATTLVWHEGLPDWQPYGGLAPAAVAPSRAPAAAGTEPPVRDAVCCECGRTFPCEDMIQLGGSWVCAACKPLAVQKLKESVQLPGTLCYAGFWVRFAAKFVDGIITGVLNFAVAAVVGVLVGAVAAKAGGAPAALGAMALSYAINITLSVAYTTFFVGKFAATPGKMAAGLKVVRADGGKVSYGRAFGRTFAEWLSGLTLTIGYIMAAFDDEKRALHDRICDTRVVKK